jgi:hypothetical protein
MNDGREGYVRVGTPTTATELLILNCFVRSLKVMELDRARRI